MSEDDIIKTIEKAENAPADPIKLFMQWMKEAEETEPSDPNAMCLSTLDPDGKISSRIVLLKGLSARGFIFYTNQQSRKAEALAANPFAGLNFYWKTLERQVRIQGNIEKVGDGESDTYFATRSRGSRIGAWASEQSRRLESRTQLQERVKEFEQKFVDDQEIPRPPHWGGYLVKPDLIEFWHNGAFRLHSRVVYKASQDGWDKEMLYP